LIVKIKRPIFVSKVNYSCGEVAQKNYLNIDIRYTKEIDIIGDLRWCRRNLKEYCVEVYLSHVLEHNHYPSRSMSRKRGAVNYALDCVYDMLTPGGQF
jgi:predicted SAM-dependent methyltransferase